MSYAAVGAIDDAIDATKEFLTPFEVGTWLRLAVVVFFVAGGSGVASYVQNGMQFVAEFDDTSAGALPSPEVGLLVIGVLAVVGLVFLVFFVVTPIMEFVFVQSLFDEEVHLRRYFSRHLGNGLRLLAFKIVLGLVGLLVFGGLFLLAALIFVGTDAPLAAFSALFVLAVPFLLLYAIVVQTISGFTTVFVVPIMILEDRGIVAGWSRLWSTMTDDVGEFLVYLVISVILGYGVGIISSFVSLFALLILGLPFGLLGFAIATVTGGGIAMIAALAVLGVVFLACFLLLMNLIQVPLQSFLRYFALLVLGDVDEDLDAIPALRARIRS